MSYTFRPAVREQVGLFIGLAGGTGSGKTWTAMLLAEGISGGKPFAVIDTENKRASHYADDFKFDVLDLTAPFNPGKYKEAVKTAFDKGYPAIIVDSVSHEHDGEGGFLDMQVDDLEGRVKRYMDKYPNSKEFEVMQKLTPSSWQKPKAERKRMIQTMLSCSSTVPIIFCFRAEQKSFKSEGGKLVARKIPEWEPICAKGMPFEMTVFFMFDSEKPGIPSKVIKLQEQHKSMFLLDKPLGKESGRLIAQWASGGKPQQKAKQAETKIKDISTEYKIKNCPDIPTLEELYKESKQAWEAKVITELEFETFKQLVIERKADLITDLKKKGMSRVTGDCQQCVREKICMMLPEERAECTGPFTEED